MIETRDHKLIGINKSFKEQVKKQRLKPFKHQIRFNQNVMGEARNLPVILSKNKSGYEGKLGEEFDKVLDEMIRRMR